MHSALDSSGGTKAWEVPTGDGKLLLDLAPDATMTDVVKKFTQTGGKAVKEEA